MKEIVKRYPLASALAVLAGLLVLVLALEYASGASLRGKLAGAGSSNAVPVQSKLLPPIAPVNPEQEYAETAARPLFIPTRRPAPVVAAANVGNMAKGQFILTGVISANGTKIALLREKSSGRVVRVEQGKDVNGITVAQIDPEQVTLAQGGDQEVIPLLVSKGAPAAAAPAMPAAPVAAAGPFASPAIPVGVPGANPAARPPPTVSNPPSEPVAPGPGVNPNLLFGPRPGGLTPGNSYVPPAPDPSTGAQPSSQAAPLTPEEILARRRARRTQ
jgi:hypothetical protein